MSLDPTSLQPTDTDGQPSSQPLRATRVLVVEDDSSQRMVLLDLLEAEGIDALGCPTPEAALDLVRQSTGIGVVILDLQLSGASGMQLLDDLHAMDPDLRVVINTGCGSFDSAMQAVNRGAFAYVEKAEDPSQLLTYVQRAIHSKLDKYTGVLEQAVVAHSAQLHAANESLQAQTLEQARLQARLQQAQKMESIGTLASGIAHDFNNLLTVIRGYAEFAGDAVEDEAVLQDLEGIQEAVGQATELTRSLLLFAGGSAGEGAEHEPLNMDRLVTGAARMLRRLLPATITLDVDGVDQRTWVHGNQTQLQQVIFNLVLNAVDGSDGEGVVRLTCRAAGDGQLDLGVADQGRGIPERMLQRVFDPFFTSKSKGQGTGLGLSIVHGIVQEHGGEIRIESQEGVGTEVLVTLPTCPPAETKASPPLPLDNHAEGTGHILLAEDNPMVFRLVRNALVDAGFQVLGVQDGLAALEAIEDHGPALDLLLCDVDLPGISGLDCIRQVRALASRLPAILISGRPAVFKDATLQDVAFLAKPFGTRELLDLVRGSLMASREAATAD